MSEDSTINTDFFKGLKFYKLCASGNDFVIIPDLKDEISKKEAVILAQKVCRPKFGIGADGLILVKPAKDTSKASFSWWFFNSDGSEAEMCGNGARCVSRLVEELKLFKSPFFFETKAGLIFAEVKGKKVKVALTHPRDLKLNIVLRTDYDWFLVHFVNTGVPHVVLFWEDIENAPVEKLGSKIRFHPYFEPHGTNVNFASIIEDVLWIRTYERGVEAETLACGTGSAASAYVAVKLGLIKPPVKVRTRGGETLTIYIENEAGEEKIFLEGNTIFAFSGNLNEDILT